MENNKPAVLMIFDGECSLCHSGVKFLAKRIDIKRPPLYFVASTSPAGERLLGDAGHDPQNLTTIIVYASGKFHEKSMAISTGLKSCRVFWRFLGGVLGLIPNWIADFFYDLVARNRKKFFKNDSCSLNPDIQKMNLVSLDDLKTFYPELNQA